jgi:hypothetical protein
MATFRDIVSKQREKGEGIGSSLKTAFSERAKERLDPRNYLFNRKGILASLFPSLKGYQAKTGDKLKGQSSGLGAGAESSLNTIADLMGDLKRQLRMIAKSSLVLPQMARDTSITKQNIKKLVRAQGDTPENNSEKAFFFNAAKRESIYENNMKAGKPTRVKEEKKEEKDKSVFQKILEFILGTVGSLFRGLTSIIPDLVSGLSKLSGVIGSILAIAASMGLKGIGAVTGTMGKIAGTAGRVAGKVPGLGRGLLAAGAGAGAALASGAGRLLGLRKAPGGLDKLRGSASTSNYLKDLESGKAGKDMAKSKSLWGRFLTFIERKSPKLFTRIGARLATAASLVTVPLLGWVAAAIEIGFTLWTAYELYQLWREFTDLDNTSEERRPTEERSSNSPTSSQYSTNSNSSGSSGSPNMSNTSGQQSNTPQREMLPGESIRDVIGQSEGGKTGYNASYGFGAGKQDPKIKDLFGSKYGENVQLTDLTIGDALKYAKGRGGNQGALGKYQFMPSVVEGLLSGARLNLTDKFSSENQDKLYNVYSNRNKQALEQGLQGTGIPITADVLHLAHSVGAGGAIKLLKHGDQNAKVADVLGLKGAARSTNPQLEQSITQYRSKLAGKYSPNALSNTNGMQLNDASQINRQLMMPSSSNSGTPVVNNVVNNNGGGGSGTTFVASANLYDKDLVDLFMDSLGTA